MRLSPRMCTTSSETSPPNPNPTRNIAAPVATAAAVTEPPQDYDYRWVERDD